MEIYFVSSKEIHNLVSYDIRSTLEIYLEFKIFSRHLVVGQLT